MLVLSRKEDQKTILTVPPSSEPTVIEVMPVRTTKHDVQLGFVAPMSVAIVRDDMRPEVNEGRYR